jgi:DNA ligase-1
VKLCAVVEASARVAATRRRLEKVELLAGCLARLGAEELRAGVAFLTGELRQGRIGLGAAAPREVQPPAAAAATLSLLDVDAGFGRMARTAGPGSKVAKLAALSELLSRATRDEHHFLRRLLFGELRQGALEGVMEDAIAKAFGLHRCHGLNPPPTVVLG